MRGSRPRCPGGPRFSPDDSSAAGRKPRFRRKPDASAFRLIDTVFSAHLLEVCYQVAIPSNDVRPVNNPG